MEHKMTNARADAERLRDELKAWALDHAFPLWWEVGADHVKGGFFEKIAQDGTPVEAPRRARVQPRQIYSYAVAGLLGWTGPWKQALNHGLDFYLAKYRRPDGFMRTLVASDGAPLDDKVDLYDQAFGLFGLAMAAQVLPERTDLPVLAAQLRDRLHAELKHPVAGFEESVPRSLPLLSNPHMHLFEASLAWLEVSGEARWRSMADEIAELALSKFIDPVSGGLREYYDGDWNPAPGVTGRIIEPGHQFEWAWLLLRWGKLAGRDDAQAVKMLVDGLKAKGRDLTQRHVSAIGDGVERQPLTHTGLASVEVWRFTAGASATLPPSTIQVLDGALTGEAALAAGDRRDLTVQTGVTATHAATVLVTTWR